MNLPMGLVVGYVAFVLETALVPLLGGGALSPRPVLAMLVWVVWRSDGRTGLLIAAAWGLMADGISQGPLGVDLIAFVVAAAALQFVRSRSSGSPLQIGAMAGVVVLFVPIAGNCARFASELQPIDIERLCLAAIGPACSTAVLAATCGLLWRFVFGHPTATGTASPTHVSNRWRMLTE